MDFVTLTDHDTIDGAMEITNLPDVLVGEELSCWFPEDNCKLHVLVYGTDRAVHDALQSRARNIYDVADFIEHHQIAHAVAHPIYRQNDKLERWHVERLLLLFKGFECLNGAHSPLHREAFEPLLDGLTPEEIRRLGEIHGLAPRWPEPWVKARAGGSDDHGLLNVGRTWTEFPGEVRSARQLHDCLRSGMCKPGGEAGSSAKLAHTFFGIAVRYYARQIMPAGAKPNLTTSLLQTIVGEQAAPSKAQITHAIVSSRLRQLCKRVVFPFAKRQARSDEHTAILKRLFIESLNRRVREYPQL